MAEYIEREAEKVSTDGCIEKNKIKTHFAVIILEGSIENPYYSILWLDETKHDFIIGFSSFYLGYVLKWLKEEFEIVCTDEKPYADIVPVRHGRWIKESDGGTKCSVCNKRVRDVTDGVDEPVDLSEMPYCPKCGARMDGDCHADD